MARVAKILKVEGTLADTPKRITFRDARYEQGEGAHTIPEVQKSKSYWEGERPKDNFIIVKSIHKNKPYHMHRGTEVFYWLYVRGSW